MRILVLASDYPKPGRLFGGVFNERSVHALKDLCDHIEVLVPRPYAPALTKYVPRWKIHALTPKFQTSNGVPVFRPAVPIMPRIGSAFWLNQGAFLWCRKMMREMHRRAAFDAVLAFDLSGPGGIAWRIGQDLGITSSGWATGGDIRQVVGTPFHRSVSRTLQRLDLVFYQSHELRQRAADLIGIPYTQLSCGRHITLPRGIADPPELPKVEVRQRVRAELELTNDRIVVLAVGRISHAKGIFELLEAISMATKRDSRIVGVIVGSSPSDATSAVRRELDTNPELKERVKLLPACPPHRVWEYLCAADIFVFASHNEGMPNSLLEAMAMRVPCVAFAIPPVLEIDAGMGVLLTIPPFDVRLFAGAIEHLANSPDERERIGKQGESTVMRRYLTKTNMATALERIKQFVYEQRKPGDVATRII